jgi:hypothetical protein
MGGTRRLWWHAAMSTVVVGLATAGCAVTATGSTPDPLLGRWEWREAEGGFAGHRISPATEGFRMELRFAPGGEARLYRDGGLVGIAGYQTTRGEEGGSFPGQEVVRFDLPLLGGWEEMAVSLPTPDLLVLTDGCCDGFTHRFDRVGSAP